MIDLTGKKFNKLTVLRYAGLDNNRNHAWECRCDCGMLKIVKGCHLTMNKTVSCGCYKRSRVTIDMKGQQIGKLTVIEFDGIISKHAWWKCKCECGKIISVPGPKLRKGIVKSCRDCYLTESEIKIDKTLTKEDIEWYNGLKKKKVVYDYGLPINFVLGD